MAALRRFVLRVTSLFRSSQAERELDRELSAHLALIEDDYRAAGMPEAEARRAARLAIGGLAQTKERHRDARAFRWLRDSGRDTHHACRALVEHPAFSALIIVTLALGIGANVAIFSVINGLMLRPLPVEAPARLGMVVSTPGHDVWTYATWDQLRRRTQMFDGASAWSDPEPLALGTGQLRADGVYVSGDFFKILGIKAVIGRPLTEADDVRPSVNGAVGPDGAVAVIGYQLWQRQFGGSSKVIGTSLLVGGVPFTVVGVTPRNFFGLEVGRAVDVYLPLGTEPLIRRRQSLIDDALVTHWLHVMARLNANQSFEEGTAALRLLQPQVRAAAMPNQLPRYREAFLKDAMTLAPIDTGTSSLRAEYSRPLLVLLALVMLVLIVACVDIANLLLGRAASRQHEFVVRRALGASSGRLARQALVEGIVLAVVSTCVALVFATLTARTLVTQVSDVAMLDAPIDWRVLLFSLALVIVSTLICTAVPALRATRVTPVDVLKTYGRQPGTHSRASGPNAILIVAQVALTMVLIIVSGLLLRTLLLLTDVPLGFDSDRVLVASVNAADAAAAPNNRGALYQQLVDEVASRPQVAGAAGSIATPLGQAPFVEVLIDQAAGLSESSRVSKLNFVTPGWFAAYGVPLNAGRDFDRRDGSGAQPVVVVNEAFVRRFFPDRTALGASFAVAAGGGNLPMGVKTVVGVVGDTVGNSLRQGLQPMLYVPLAQWAFPVPLFARFLIGARARSGSPTGLTSDIVESIVTIDHGLKVSAAPVSGHIADSVRQERMIARLSSALAALALLLSVVGHYGVTAYAVRRRRSEIGIRMALGASAAHVVTLVVKQTLRMTSIGVALGVGLAFGAARTLRALLFGVSPFDPTTFIVVAVMFFAVATLAAIVPAFRAATAAPLSALRTE